MRSCFCVLISMVYAVLCVGMDEVVWKFSQHLEKSTENKFETLLLKEHYVDSY